MVVMVVKESCVRNLCNLHQRHHAYIERRPYPFGFCMKDMHMMFDRCSYPWVLHQCRSLSEGKLNHVERILYFLYVKLRLSCTTQYTRTSFNTYIYVFQSKSNEHMRFSRIV